MLGAMYIQNVIFLDTDKNPQMNQSEAQRSLFKYSPSSDTHQPKFSSQINDYIGNQLKRNSLTLIEQNVRNFSPYTLSDYKHKYDGAVELSKGLGDNIGTKEWKAREDMRKKIRDYSEQINSRNHYQIKPLCLPPKEMREKNLLDQMKGSSKFKAMEYGKEISPYSGNLNNVVSHKENNTAANNEKWKLTYDRKETKTHLNNVYFQSLNNRGIGKQTKEDRGNISNYVYMMHNFKENLI